MCQISFRRLVNLKRLVYYLKEWLFDLNLVPALLQIAKPYAHSL
jgi:hypothetical protein